MPAIATTGGPATNSCAVPFTITEKCEQTTRGARPAPGPSAAAAAGTAEVLDQVEAGQRRDIGEAHLLARLDAAAAARAVHEADERQPEVVRHALRVDGLLPDGRVGGAAADGEVVALHHRTAAADPSLTDDGVGRQEAGQLAVLAIGPAAGERTGLVERARVEEPLDPLTNRQPARLMPWRPAPRRPSAERAPRAFAAPRARAPTTLDHPKGVRPLKSQRLKGSEPFKTRWLRMFALARECLARRLLAGSSTVVRCSSARSRRRSSRAASRRGSLGATSSSASQSPHFPVIPVRRPSSSTTRLSGE